VKASHWFIPVFRLAGKRYRCRFRFVAPFQLWSNVQVFDDRVVHTVRLGWLLFVAMIDGEA
jgi:hypothetical protein